MKLGIELVKIGKEPSATHKKSHKIDSSTPSFEGKIFWLRFFFLQNKATTQ
jgi:hypothetical protein